MLLDHPKKCTVKQLLFQSLCRCLLNPKMWFLCLLFRPKEIVRLSLHKSIPIIEQGNVSLPDHAFLGNVSPHFLVLEIWWSNRPHQLYTRLKDSICNSVWSSPSISLSFPAHLSSSATPCTYFFISFNTVYFLCYILSISLSFYSSY